MCSRRSNLLDQSHARGGPYAGAFDDEAGTVLVLCSRGGHNLGKVRDSLTVGSAVAHLSMSSKAPSQKYLVETSSQDARRTMFLRVVWRLEQSRFRPSKVPESAKNVRQ